MMVIDLAWLFSLGLIAGLVIALSIHRTLVYGIKRGLSAFALVSAVWYFARNHLARTAMDVIPESVFWFGVVTLALMAVARISSLWGELRSFRGSAETGEDLGSE